MARLIIYSFRYQEAVLSATSVSDGGGWTAGHFPLQPSTVSTSGNHQMDPQWTHN